MPNRSTDALFQLVKSLEKSEKAEFQAFCEAKFGQRGFEDHPAL